MKPRADVVRDARQLAVDVVVKRVEAHATRELFTRPAKDALARADELRGDGNDRFRRRAFDDAAGAYHEALATLAPAFADPTTSYAAETARVVLLSNAAQCAIETRDLPLAVARCLDALSTPCVASDARAFKKLLLRLARAYELGGDLDAARAVAREAALRGVGEEEFAEARARIDPTGILRDVGKLRDGVETRMFIMLALRMSAGEENLARVRAVLENGDLPHVDRRDEMGNNVLWGVLNALTFDVEDDDDDGGAAAAAAAAGETKPVESGADSVVPTLSLLLAAGADPCQRYERGKTPLMFAAGSGSLAAVRAILGAFYTKVFHP
jgi:hypothetical protein